MKTSTIKNGLFFIIILLLIVPSTRLPIQVFLNKGLAMLSPSLESSDKQITNYNWKLKTLNNTSINFNKTKGKVTLVNFWATWCPPCIAEMPSLQKLHNDYKDKIEFILVSSEKEKKITSFLNKKGYNLNSYIPTEPPQNIFRVSSIPRTFLIDKDGKIVIDETGAANWNSNKVRKIIDELLAK